MNAILPILLLSSGLITAGGVSTIDFNEIDDDEYSNMISNVLNDISSYIQIKDMTGKYSDGEIHQVAILMSSLLKTNIDISNITIKLAGNDDVRIQQYNGVVKEIGSESLFTHSIWKNVTTDTFALLVIRDSDNSLENDILNNDLAYIVIELPNGMKKGELLEVTLFPSLGVQRTIVLEAPLPIKSVVRLDENL